VITTATDPASTRRRANEPWLVELVGPAGVGKSTLATTLPSADPDVSNGPNLWGLPRGLLALSAIALIPTIVAAALSGHPLRSAEIGQMVRIGALRRAIERAARKGYRTMVIDEGPVFGLTWLEVFYESDDDPWRALWRRRERERWSETLDAVVRLDAPDHELARRIRTRAKQHMVKASPDHEIEAFMKRFRSKYDQVIGDMAARGRVSVQVLDSTGGPVLAEAERLRAAIRETICER
jgi:energy-coupling factor transporter ATP-binding protein EcfA2